MTAIIIYLHPQKIGMNVTEQAQVLCLRKVNAVDEYLFGIGKRGRQC